MGKPINCGTNCEVRHPFNSGRRDQCNLVKRCACGGGSLEAISPYLSAGYASACGSDNPPKDPEDYMCNHVGGQAMFTHYGQVVCGYNVEESAQFMGFEAEAEAYGEQTKSAFNMQRGLIWGLGLMIAAAFAYLIYDQFK